MFSSNTCKVHFEGFGHLLRYTRDNHNLGLRYYANMEDAPLFDLLKQARIKTDNQLMVLYNSSTQDCPYNGISTGAYIVFYQGEPIYHCTYVTGPVDQSSSESDYNAEFTVGMTLAHFRMPNDKSLKKEPDVVT